MPLPSQSSIKADNLRRKKLLSEAEHNVSVVIEEMRKEPKIKDTSSRILVMDRRVLINQKEISLKWLHSPTHVVEFTHLFQKLLEEALLKEGFCRVAYDNNAFLFKYYVNDSELPVD